MEKNPESHLALVVLKGGITMKKSNFAIGQYINVFHPYDPKYFDVFFILNECCCPKDKHFYDKLLNVVQPIIEKAYDERNKK